MQKVLSKIIAKAPTTCGIYKFLNEKKEPIYIGKAKSLKKRLQSYFRKSTQRTPRTEKMLEKVKDIEWIKTNNEIESLILEDNLIKELQPRYNVRLRDDKNFQYIKVSVADDYPEVTTVRRIAKDNARYFGPKTSGGDVQHLMESVKKIFKLCSSRNIKLAPKGALLEGAKVAVKVGGSSAKRPCLDFHIKRCTGPCAGMVTPAEYRAQIDAALNFLSGNYKPAIEALKKQMAEFAKDQKFERAAAMRDQISAIERSAQKQLITDTAMSDRDVIAFVEDFGKNYFVLFQIRAGKLIAEERFTSEGGESPGEVMAAFLREYYGMAADIPPEVVISTDAEGHKVLEDYIRKQTGHTVRLIRPQAGRKDDLVILAIKNARSFADASRVSWEVTEKRAEAALEELEKTLKIEGDIRRIECYDISHLGGTETIGSMVVFKKGKPAYADYRQFRLRSTVNANDDYKSMEEVLTRRLNYLPAELPKGYKIRKAKKGDFKFIKATIEKEPINNKDLDVKEFYIIEKNKKIIAFVRLHPLDEAIDDISSLWVDPKERGKKLGHHLIKKVIDVCKHNRVYMDSVKSLEEYCLKLGFEILRKPPKALLDKIERFKKDKKAVAKAKKAHGDKIEVVYMAYQKKKRDLSFESKPDLIVIDGGKGQLGAAVKVLESKGLGIHVIALAKEKEEVFIPGKPDPIDLKPASEAGYLLQRLRDEAHRFALEANRGSRDKKMIKSALDSIPGIGPKMKKKLLTHFGSVAAIKTAHQVQLEGVVGEDLAIKIKESL